MRTRAFTGASVNQLFQIRDLPPPEKNTLQARQDKVGRRKIHFTVRTRARYHVLPPQEPEMPQGTWTTATAPTHTKQTETDVNILEPQTCWAKTPCCAAKCNCNAGTPWTAIPWDLQEPSYAQHHAPASLRWTHHLPRCGVMALPQTHWYPVASPCWARSPQVAVTDVMQMPWRTSSHLLSPPLPSSID